MLLLLLACAPKPSDAAAPDDTGSDDTGSTDTGGDTSGDTGRDTSGDTGRDTNGDTGRDTSSDTDTSPEDTSTGPVDSDGDGYDDDVDCRPEDAAVHPGATERCVTAADDDCDGQVNEDGAEGCEEGWPDTDGDGWGTGSPACTCEGGGAGQDGDCDDADASVFPDAPDPCGDGVDADCDLSDECDVGSAPVLFAGDADELCGWQLAASHDVTGDGTADLVLTCPYDHGAGGGVYVCEGPVTEGMACSTSIEPGSGSQWLGTKMAVAELDGDGIDDVVLGAPWDGAGGAVHVLQTPPATGDVYSGSRTLWAAGHPFLGWSVAAGADLDGDGAPEIVAYSATTETYLGYAGDSPDGTLDDTFSWTVYFPRSGYVDDAGVATPGDLDGDGQDDLVVAADLSRADGNFAVHLGPLTAPQAYADGDALVLAAVPGEQLGNRVSPAGDVDGDSLVDYVVFSEVAAYLFTGGGLTAATAADATATFPDAGLLDAHGDAARVDLDGDGTDELLLGAHQYGGAYEGLVGAWASPFVGEQTLADALGSWVGPSPSDLLGTDLAPAGDVDGDALQDFVVALLGSDRTATDGGEVLLGYGRAF